MKSRIKSATGSRLSILVRSLSEFAILAPAVITQESPSYPKSLARNSCAADCALRLGRTARARPSRHRHHRRAAHDTLRGRIRKEALLSARLCGIDRHQRTRAWHRHGRASGRTGSKRSHDRGDRLRTGETLSAGKRCARRENSSGNGAIVSEFSMEIEPDRQTFPMRNRIISGWSHGILVVEAGLNSGALITASQALEQGRSVYAVPGHINAPSAMGSNRLIQQGAKLVMDASDILDDLQILLPETKPSPKPPHARCRPFQRTSAASMTPSKRRRRRLMKSQRKRGCRARQFRPPCCNWN